MDEKQMDEMILAMGDDVYRIDKFYSDMLLGDTFYTGELEDAVSNMQKTLTDLQSQIEALVWLLSVKEIEEEE
jgi:hypothetical protein